MMTTDDPAKMAATLRELADDLDKQDDDLGRAFDFVEWAEECRRIAAALDRWSSRANPDEKTP